MKDATCKYEKNIKHYRYAYNLKYTFLYSLFLLFYLTFYINDLFSSALFKQSHQW